MAKQTTAERRAKGLYWDRVYKINEGCTKCSPGCDNCWSETETLMRSKNPNDKVRLRARDVVIKTGHTGTFEDNTICGYEETTGFDSRILLRHDNIDLPLHVKKPAVFAVWNDLFHIDVPCDFINQVYDFMVQSPQHTFLVLTKRSSAMARYINFAITEDSKQTPVWIQRCTDEEGEFYFPSNVYHGVTICNQAEADKKIPHLLQVPGKRFLSIEPMLSNINLSAFMGSSPSVTGERILKYSDVNQVLLGGESGKNARPMHPAWIRSVRDQCQDSGVSFNFKQHGEWRENIDGSQDSTHVIGVNGTVAAKQASLVCEDLINHDDGVWIKRVGKKNAGRELDGKFHNQLIWDKEK